MISRPLTFLFLFVVVSSGCRTPRLSSDPVRTRPFQPATVETSGLESTGSGSKPDPVEDPQQTAAIATGACSIEPVNWSVFEDVPPLETGASPPPQRECDLCRNVRNFGPTLWEDTQGVVQIENAVVLGVALAAAIGIRQGPDDRVREATDDNPTRWGDATRVLGYLGEPQYQIPLLIALSGYAVHTNNPECYDFSEALLSAYTINGLATLAIKGVSNTSRPDTDWNDGQWGFPSFHAGSAFAIAAVVQEYHGWGAGLPAYTLAGLISWSRIDQRDHDLSDVVFGAAMGWVIGRSVASRHLDGDGRVMVCPWMHPTEPALGMAVETKF